MMMLSNRKVTYVFVLLLLFLLQTTLIFWLLPGNWADRLSPHLVMIGVLFAALFVSRHYALVLGLCFGLLHDVMYYGHMIGIYTFVHGLIGYFSGLALVRKHMTFFYIGMVVALGSFVFDTFVALIYMLFRVVDEPFKWALLHHILPSVFFNLFLYTTLYVPLRTFVEKIGTSKQEEEDHAISS